MLEVDLLADFVTPAPAGPAPVTSDVPNEGHDYFTKQFWGEKLQGFDILYHNMKHGQTSIKSLQEFIRESALSEDLCSKNLTKVAKMTAGFNPAGTFAPLFDSLKTVAEKLSSCHMDIVHKLQELTKELAKYLEEQKAKHKQVKEEMSGTSNAVQQLQSTTVSVMKHKEKYHQCCIDTERLKRISAAPKEIEKAESKAKRAEDEYRSSVEKYATIRDDYEQKMTESAKKFQELETVHLEKMRQILESYILSYENGNVLMGQVHQEFRRQIGEKSIETLLKQYSQSKGTGTAKPELIKFEECDVEAALLKLDQTDGIVSDVKSPPPTTTRIGPINLPFRRKKTRKSPKDSVSGIKSTNTIDSPDKENEAVPQVDEEGYTIRPESPKDPFANHKQEQSDSSDSDWDDVQTKKIHVKINPKDASSSSTTDNNLDTLNAITKNLTLSSPTLLAARKLTPEENEFQSNVGATNDGQKSKAQQILDLFGNNNVNSTSNSVFSSPASNNSAPALEETFGENPPQPIIPQSPSNLSLNNLFIMPQSKGSEADATTTIETKLNSAFLPTTPSPDLGFTDSVQNNGHKGSSTGFTSPDSVSSHSSFGAFPTENFASSRDPSPLPPIQVDPIRIAVAFTETVNALFKGANNESCRAQIIGDVHISFPSANVHTLITNPNPPQLKFSIKGVSKIDSILPKHAFISVDNSQSTSQQRSFKFDTLSLSAHLKKLSEANPAASHYNVPVLSYQINSQSGHDLVPLLFNSSWKCETNLTEVSVNYKYNNSSSSAPLTNAVIIISVNGGVTRAQSVPEATWNSSQNRLSWTLSSPISSNSPPGSLQSKLSLASGPSTLATLGVRFQSEGATLSGADFELTGAGYRVMLVVKKFSSGKYFCEPNLQSSFLI